MLEKFPYSEPTVLDGTCKPTEHNFHIRIVRLDIIKCIYSPSNTQVIVLKTILKFILKYHRHVSV